MGVTPKPLKSLLFLNIAGIRASHELSVPMPEAMSRDTSHPMSLDLCGGLWQGEPVPSGHACSCASLPARRRHLL